MLAPVNERTLSI